MRCRSSFGLWLLSLSVALAGACGDRQSLGSRRRGELGDVAASGTTPAEEAGPSTPGMSGQETRPDAYFVEAEAAAHMGSAADSGDAADSSCVRSLALEPEPQFALLVVERSSRMRQPLLGTDLTRWQGVRQALVNQLANVPAHVSLGLETFPFPGTHAAPIAPECTTDCCEQVQGAEAIQVQAERYGSILPQVLAIVDATPPAGGAPTAAALEAARQFFSASDYDRPGGKHVMLIVAGSGNCAVQPEVSCNYERCTFNLEGLDGCTSQPSTGGSPPVNCCSADSPPLGARGCADDDEVRSHLAKLEADGVHVWVVALPSTDAYGTRLMSGDPLMPSTRFIGVTNGNELSADLGLALQRLASGCRFQTVIPTSSEVAAVWLDGAPVPSGDYDVERSPSPTIVLHQAECNQFYAGAAHELSVRIRTCDAARD